MCATRNARFHTPIRTEIDPGQLTAVSYLMPPQLLRCCRDACSVRGVACSVDSVFILAKWRPVQPATSPANSAANPTANESLQLAVDSVCHVSCCSPAVLWYSGSSFTFARHLYTQCVTWGGGRFRLGPWSTQNFGWVYHNAFDPTNNWSADSFRGFYPYTYRAQLAPSVKNWGSVGDPMGEADTQTP